MYHFRIRTALCLALLASSPLALAATPPASAGAGQQARPAGHPGQHGNQHEMTLMQQLDLTDTQRTSIRQMMRDSFQQARPSMQALRQQRIAFNEATPGSSNYQTLANNLAQAEATAAHDDVLRQAELRTKMYNVLTPAQRTKLAQLRTERRARFEKWQQEHQGKAAAGQPASSSR